MNAEERLSICKKCPLWTVLDSGPVCDSSKYINSEQQVSYIAKPGYVKGCACHMEYKVRNPNAHCIVNLW